MGINSSVRSLLTSNLRVVFICLSILFLLDLGIIVIFAYQYPSNSQKVSVGMIGFSLAFAALIIGYFIGFIFGLPRINPHGSHSVESNSYSDTLSEEESTKRSLYSENSNLENISDWLSKILVGIGLIQLTQVPAYLQQFSDFLEPALSGRQINAGIFGTSVVIFCLLDGFLIGYLWTRCYAPIEFGKKRSDLQNITNDMRTIRQDFEVHNLVDRILNHDETEKEIELHVDELKRQIWKASDGTKEDIYVLAKEHRQKFWIINKQKMELSIPIFRLLIIANPENHNYYAQLGFALKDKRIPDWKEASEKLTEAIKKFPDSDKFSYKIRLYRINRAMCNINLDTNFNKNMKSDDSVTSSIMEDLLFCETEEYIKNNFLNDQTKPIKKWMELNNKSMEDLKACTQ